MGKQQGDFEKEVRYVRREKVEGRGEKGIALILFVIMHCRCRVSQ